MIKAISVTIVLAGLCAISQQNPATKLGDQPDYSGCGITSWCFGLPDGCADKQKCEVLLRTEALVAGNVEFELFWARMKNSNDSWVAAGISTDKNAKMNGASVSVFIIQDDGNVTAQLGQTHVGGNNTGFTPLTVKGITVENKNYVNGLLRAKWVRDQTITVDKTTFDLKMTKYYIILARGPVKDSHIQPHTVTWASKDVYDLETEPVPPKVSTTPATTPATTKPASSTTTGKQTTTASTASQGSSTGSTGNSTTVSGNSTTGTPAGTTPKPKTTQSPGSASAISMSFVLAIFVSIVFFLN